MWYRLTSRTEFVNFSVGFLLFLLFAKFVFYDEYLDDESDSGFRCRHLSKLPFMHF